MPGFKCPECGQSALAIRQVIELPGDSRSDDIDLQLLKCDGCGVKVAGIYEESRRGGGDSVDHYGLRVSWWWHWRIEGWIKRCPAPRNRACDCAVHGDLGAKADNGRLRLFAGLDRANSFPLKLAPDDIGVRLPWPPGQMSPPPEARPATAGNAVLTLNELGLLGVVWPPAGK